MSSKTGLLEEAIPLFTNSNKQWMSTGVLNEDSSNVKPRKTQSYSNIHPEIEDEQFSDQDLTFEYNITTLSSKSASIEDLDDKFSRCSLVFNDFQSITLSWQNIRVDVPHHRNNICQQLTRKISRKQYKTLNRKQILKNVTGVALPGRVLAIMGAR